MEKFGKKTPSGFEGFVYLGKKIIIPKAELRDISGGFPYYSQPFGVTSADFLPCRLTPKPI